MYNVYNHYWLADDGRLFASLRQIITDANDADYVAWGQEPTPWPRDEAGNQTNDTLQDVLRPNDIFVDLGYYAGHARSKKLSGDIVVNGLLFSTDPLTLGSLNSAWVYVQAKSQSSFSWKLPDGSFITLNTADITALHDAANTFAQNCFLCEDTTLTAIEGGTITTREEVDAAFAAVSNTFTGLRSAKELKLRHKRK